MGEITTTVDRDAELTVRTVTGAVTAQQIVDAMAEYFATGPTRLVLWDFTEAMLEGVSAGEVRALAEATTRFVGGRPAGKTALVFSSPFSYGLGRLFDQLRNGREATVAYMSFRDRGAAMAWLRESGTG
jgi:hypothetical protein